MAGTATWRWSWPPKPSWPGCPPVSASALGANGTKRAQRHGRRIAANESEANDKPPRRPPDYRAYAGTGEPGAAWRAQPGGDEPRDCLSAVLGDPSFPQPIRAALFEDDGAALLVWNRRER